MLLAEECSLPNEDLTSGETDTQTDVFISEDEDDDIGMDDDEENDELKERERERLRIRSIDTVSENKKKNTWNVSPGKHATLNQPFRYN